MSAVPAFSRDPVIQAYLELSTTNVSDALDRLQLRGAPHGILPLWTGCQKIVGRAMTMKLVSQGSASPVLGTLEAIIAAEPADVLVIDHDGLMDVNSFGGIAAFTAVKYGLVGVVIDGVTRDVDEMKDQGFAAYGKGVIQQSIRNRCAFAGHSVEVQLAGCSVRRGDLVMGDDNGVVIVPQGHIAEALRIAQECAETEEKVKDMIAQGVHPVEAHERVGYDQMTRGRQDSAR
jgi:4-hydroxy-4-methyl-2-oxoglutarate aldolase